MFFGHNLRHISGRGLEPKKLLIVLYTSIVGFCSTNLPCDGEMHMPFLDCLAHALRPDERFILCAFRGDPNEAPSNAWRPRPWKPGTDIPFSARNNAYVTVASFGKVADGGFRRRRDSFKAGHALMVDDVGTKVNIDIVKHVKPTAIVETSPGNEQWWYMLKEPERDFRLIFGDGNTGSWF